MKSLYLYLKGNFLAFSDKMRKSTPSIQFAHTDDMLNSHIHDFKRYHLKLYGLINLRVRLYN